LLKYLTGTYCITLDNGLNLEELEMLEEKFPKKMDE